MPCRESATGAPPEMSRIEIDARDLLQERREALRRVRAPRVRAGGDAGWPGWSAGAEPVSEEARRELAEIDAALARIDEGSYGICEACGGPMGLQRLRAIPEARYCLACSGNHPVAR